METVKTVKDRYQILSTLHDGKSSTIHLAQDATLDQLVVLKEIRNDLTGDRSALEQIQTQARYVAKMNHQNIVQVYDSLLTDDGSLYVVMEYVEGMDVASLLREFEIRGQTLPPYLGIHIVAEVCKALDYAHNCFDSENRNSLNLAHKSVSPGNIIISKNGVVKLNDFGIDGLDVEKNIGLSGKVQYMSPEHVGYGAKIDKRSDIFSLGLILYELLEGKPFFPSDNVQEVIGILQNGKLKFKDMRRTPKALQIVLNKSLEKSLEQRYQNANQFYIDLVTYLVLNNDTSKIDLELSNLVSSFSNPEDLIQTTPPPRIAFDEGTDLVGEEYMTGDEDPPEPSTETLEPAYSQPRELLHEAAPLINLLQQPEEVPEYTEECEDDVKTMIDVVRLSTRGHKKQVVKGCVGAATLLVLFMLLDFTFQWTPVGAKAYDAVFPPAIKISSVPPGATVLLNGKPMPQVTPVRLDKIDPGVYELQLLAEGYEPITKSVHVPSKGQVQVQGSNGTTDQNFVFRFKTTLDLTSTPDGAEVYINNLKYSQTTPCSIPWEVGEPIAIELRTPGFENLNGFGLASDSMQEQIEDRRFWDFEARKDPSVRFAIHGKFGKFVDFKSKPVGVNVYLDDNPQPVAVTDSGNPLFLAAASHRITFKKRGYNAKTFNLTVDENSKSEVRVSLSRPVQFFAREATNNNSNDLGAYISKIVQNGKTIIRNKKTPGIIDLEEAEYEVYFKKEGFNDLKMKVSLQDTVVLALMEPMRAHLYVVILDEESGLPITNAEVRYRLADYPDSRQGVFNVTDAEGTCHGSLTPGTYTFNIFKDEYNYEEKVVEVRSSEVNLVEFTLTKANRG